MFYKTANGVPRARRARCRGAEGLCDLRANVTSVTMNCGLGGGRR